MSYYYNNNRENGEALGFMIIVFLILIPVLPAGDLGLYFAKQLSSEPMVILNIICWICFVGMYAIVLLYIAVKILYSLHISILIFLVYAQGIILSFIINDTEVAKFTPIVVKVITSVVNFLISPA